MAIRSLGALPASSQLANLWTHASRVPMEPGPCGYHSAIVEDLQSDSSYFYELRDGRNLPDPASRFQPKASTAPRRSWILSRSVGPITRGRAGISPRASFMSFTSARTPEAGTFEAIIPHLDELADSASRRSNSCPSRNFPARVTGVMTALTPLPSQNTYGGPLGLQTIGRRGA